MAKELLDRLGQMRDGVGVSTLRYGPDHTLSVGVETRTEPRDYDWPGERRGDARHPIVLLQYTLDGWGHFEAGGQRRVVSVGDLFAAVIPSAHRYYLPVASPSWSFVWFLFRQPYVVERVRERVARSGWVLSTPPDSPLVTRLTALFGRAVAGAFDDVFAWEGAMFDVLMEWERACEQQAFPRSPRETLLDGVRADVLRQLGRPTVVEALAARRGMSRSHFTHHFRATTGTSPARFVTEVRLREVARRLQTGNEKLSTIADECGFANANHLCKVFRRHYHASPGEYRRQFG